MKLRDATWAVLLGALGNLLYRLIIQPLIEPLLDQPRDRLLRALACALAASVPVFLLLRGHTFWPRIRDVILQRTRRRARTVKNTTITPETGGVELNGQPPQVTSTEPQPPGTAGTIAGMATMPAPTQQEAIRAQWEEAQRREHALAASFMLASRMRGFSAAYNDHPYNAALYNSGSSPP
jgi:hypothetical protein